MMPSCDQTGVPIHFHSSATSGSACLISLRILPRVSPRQSLSSASPFEMRSEAEWFLLATDFFMLLSWKVPKEGLRQFRPAREAIGYGPTLTGSRRISTTFHIARLEILL